MTVGEKIIKYLTKHGLSQKELAIKCKMSEPAIKNYELENRTPNKKQLEFISNALDINIFTISDPEFDTEHGVIHYLFALEGTYGFTIKKGFEISLVCEDLGLMSRLSN